MTRRRGLFPTQHWNATNQQGQRHRAWTARVLLAALDRGGEWRPCELPIPNLPNTVDAVSRLWQDGMLDMVRLGTYRLTPAGRVEAERLQRHGTRSLRHVRRGA